MLRQVKDLKCSLCIFGLFKIDGILATFDLGTRVDTIKSSYEPYQFESDALANPNLPKQTRTEPMTALPAGARRGRHLVARLGVLVAHVLVVELPVQVGLDDVEARLHRPDLRVQPHRRARLGRLRVERLHPGVLGHAARLRWVTLEDVVSVALHYLGRSL